MGAFLLPLPASLRPPSRGLCKPRCPVWGQISYLRGVGAQTLAPPQASPSAVGSIITFSSVRSVGQHLTGRGCGPRAAGGDNSDRGARSPGSPPPRAEHHGDEPVREIRAASPCRDAAPD